jgi:hypothetical protein
MNHSHSLRNAQNVFWRSWLAIDTLPLFVQTYFATGIANSAPLPMEAGQRCITLFCFV